jgi:hypothetical protein
MFAVGWFVVCPAVGYVQLVGGLLLSVWSLLFPVWPQLVGLVGLVPAAEVMAAGCLVVLVLVLLRQLMMSIPLFVVSVPWHCLQITNISSCYSECFDLRDTGLTDWSCCTVDPPIPRLTKALRLLESFLQIL